MMRLVLGMWGISFRSRNEHHDHCWSIQIDSSDCVWHDCLKPGEAKQRVLLHHGCLFEMQSDWPQAVPCGGKSHGTSSCCISWPLSFRFGEATVILVSGEALDDARVEKVAEGLERCGREGRRFFC